MPIAANQRRRPGGRAGVLVVALAACGLATVHGTAGADPGVFDPPVGTWQEPILDRAAGDAIPLDAAGIGGSMIDRLPQDPISDHEQLMIDEVVEALNLERTSRGLEPFTYSANLASIERRWVEMMSSDADDYPLCPVHVADFRSCDAAAPGFYWDEFLNFSNGPGATLNTTGGGAVSGSTAMPPGDFVRGLVASPAHAHDVLGLDGRFAGVGLKCLPDGRTYLEWSQGDYDSMIKLADPDTYQGPDVPAFTPAGFGHRCPQPGPEFAARQVGRAIEVVLTEPTQLASGRHAIDGPVLSGAPRMHVEVTDASEQLVYTATGPFGTLTEYLPYTTPPLAPGNYRVAVSVANDYETSQISSTTVEVVDAPILPGLEPLEPARVLDTREGRPTTDGLHQGDGRVHPGGVAEVQIAGRAGVPAGAEAVVMNVTAVAPTDAGHLTVYPCGTLPTASTVNYGAGEVVPNGAVVRLDEFGRVCVFTFAETDVVIDVTGFVPPGGSPDTVVPARLLDTRAGRGTVDGRFAATGRVEPGSVSVIDIAGRGGVPSGAEAAVINLTVVDPLAPGHVTVWPCGLLPTASTVNHSAGQVRSNGAMVRLDDSGRLCVFSRAGAHLVIDVTGYVPAGGGPETTLPARVLETRPGRATADGHSQATGRMAAGSVTVVQVAGRLGVPADASAAVVNVTAVLPGAAGHLTLFPCGAVPNASTVNYLPGQVVANHAVVRLDDSGRVCVFSFAETDLLIDLTGYVR